MKHLKQTHAISATPEEVYLALTNPFTIDLWTGYPAEFDPKPDGEFSMWEGDIVGKNLELKENELLKQQWYFDGQEEDSVVTLTLKAQKQKTIVELSHENIPDEAFDEMKEGWRDNYFACLKKFFK